MRMNKSATCTESDTPVTQPRSVDVRPMIRDALDIIAIVGMASGAVILFALCVALVST
jgi:hypothetical protein